MGSVQEWINREQGKHKCQCGCNEIIIIRRVYKYRGVPRTKKGHQNRGSGNGMWKSGALVNIAGYRMIHMPHHPKAQKPRGYILEHRIIPEAYLGRVLDDDETVHHIDKMKLNNFPENLAVLSRKDHTRFHNGEHGLCWK